MHLLNDRYHKRIQAAIVHVRHYPNFPDSVKACILSSVANKVEISDDSEGLGIFMKSFFNALHR